MILQLRDSIRGFLPPILIHLYNEIRKLKTSDVNGFFPVEKKLFFFRKKTTKIKKPFFFLVSRIKFVNNGKTSCLCVK